MSIDIKNLCFSYKKKSKPVLKNVNLSISDDTITVILGLNGCGKTTLIKAIAGLFKNVTGVISYNNILLSTLSIHERSKLIAYVPQKINGIDDVKVEDYLTYGLVNSLKFYQAPSLLEKQNTLDMARKFKIEHLLHKNMGELSGGERQVVSLSSALLQNTKIILLDEPTSALDLKNQSLVLTKLKEISKAENKTVILSTHNPNHALFLDCNVALIDEGRILKYGPANTIINVENLKCIYGDNVCLSEQLPYKEISFV